MILTKLELIHFRNYSKCHVSFGEHINLFIGSNGQGKTNVLEAIYVLSLTKSHRYGEQATLIQKEKELSKIKGTLKVNGIEKDLEVDIGKTTKKVFVNQTEITKLSEYITNLNAILFTPDDLDIVKGSPQVRRNFLNIEISQMNPSYTKCLNEYNRILKTRNEYLKSIYINHLSDVRYLDVLTDKLIDRAVFIYRYRKDFLDRINQHIQPIYKDIAGYDGLEIRYETSVDWDCYEEEKIRTLLKEKFLQNRQRELQQGNTLYGPHRDDFSFYLAGENIKIFSSQGLQRLVVIALKLAEIPIFEELTGHKPILLLDDIFSEIDRKKRSKLVYYINQGVQTFITTTDLKNINKKILDNSKVFEVFSGSMKERKR